MRVPRSARLAVVAALLAVPLLPRMAAAAGATRAECRPRLLVLSAMPLELDPVLAAARLDRTPPVLLNGRPFVQGAIQGRPVILGLTGIGIVNAMRATTAAFTHYRCGARTDIAGVVFSGTSGGDYIGDVMVPARWTLDGRHWTGSDPAMLRSVRTVAAHVRLEQTTPTGDPACGCTVAPGAFGSVSTPVAVAHRPRVEVGGNAFSGDGFGNRALPCAPDGSDIFGCVPCREHNPAPVAQAQAAVLDALPFADPAFFLGYGAASAPPRERFVSQDMETAEVFRVASRYHVPVVGFRAASDGGGDPLHLPGFPAEFFVYRQLAADNAAAVAVAFIATWRVPSTLAR